MEVDLEAVVGRLLEQHGLELVELECVHRRRGPRITAYVDSVEVDVGFDVLAKADRVLSAELDELFDERYRLEVSSPGIGRPLTSVRHFHRNVGRTLHVTAREGDEVVEITGVLTAVGSSAIELNDGSGAALHFECDRIEEARVVPTIGG